MLTNEDRNFFSSEMLDLFEGRAARRFEVLHEEFRRSGIVTVPNALSNEGLSGIRRHLDVLGTSVELPNEDDKLHGELATAYGKHIEQHPFLRFILRERSFAAFLEGLTGMGKVEGRKPSMTVRTKKDGPTPEWHYDGPRVSVVIPIDDPGEGAGGGFGYFPRLRKGGAPAWKRALGKIGTKLGLHRLYRKQLNLSYTPGTLIIFDGDTTFHRAMPLTKQSLRRSLLMFFTAEGKPFTEEY